MPIPFFRFRLALLKGAILKFGTFLQMDYSQSSQPIPWKKGGYGVLRMPKQLKQVRPSMEKIVVPEYSSKN